MIFGSVLFVPMLECEDANRQYLFQFHLQLCMNSIKKLMIFLSVPFVAMHEVNETNRQFLVKFQFVAARKLNETNR